jgi:hypothetical protein
MELQTRFTARGYCFAKDLGDIEKPVYLVLDEHIDLVDDEGEWVTQKLGQNIRFNLSLDEAHELVAQVQKAIAEAEVKVEELTNA